MPQEGDVIKGKDIGRTGSHSRESFIWIVCPLCRKGRWKSRVDINRQIRQPLKRPYSVPNVCHTCAVSAKGAECHNWKGGKVFDKEGYVLVYVSPNDFFAPMRNNTCYVREHRLVMAKHLGRCLHRWELVHHKNHIKTDNRRENLQLISDTRHNQITILENRISYLESKLLSLGVSP